MSSLSFDDMSTTINGASSFLQQNMQQHQQQTLTAATALPPAAVVSKALCTPILSSSSTITTGNTDIGEETSSSSSTAPDGIIVMNGNLTSLCSSLTNLPSTPTTSSLSSSSFSLSSSTSNVTTAGGISSTLKSSSPLVVDMLLNPDVAGTALPLSSSAPQTSSLTATCSSTMLLTSVAADTEAASLPINTISTSNSSSSSVSTTSSAQLLLNGIVAGCNSNSCAINLNNTHQQQHHQKQKHIQQHQQQPQQLLSEDSRTLQLALELSMVSFNETGAVISPAIVSNTAPTTITMQHLQNLQSLHQQQQQQQQQQHHNQQHHRHQHQQLHTSHQSTATPQHQQYDFNTLSAISAAVAAAASVNNVHSNYHQNNNVNGSNSNAAALQQFSSAGSGLLPLSLDDRSKKSQNMTECVPVPSSEHVAEIVGRQGCKIKALRAKTNTYIKTPVRGEEPVFVVTGRKEDVAKAKREILSAAEHFSFIRATRKPSFDSSLSSGSVGSNSVGGGGSGCGKTPPGPPSIPGQVTIQVRVPYRVVGLVVGPKGATIKHIQQETQTYIVTPSREKEPIFEVSGLPENVQSARKQIEAHIALRTGNLPAGGTVGGVIGSSGPGSAVDVTSVHTINTLSQILNEEVNPDFLASLYKNGICSTFDYSENCSVDTGEPITSSRFVSPNSGINVHMATAGGISVHSAKQLLMGSSLSSSSQHFQIQNNPATTNNDYISNILGTAVDVDGGLYHTHQRLHQVDTSSRMSNLTFNGVNSSSTINAINLTSINCNGVVGINTSIVGNSNNNNNTNGMTRSCSSASSTTSSKSANNSGGSSTNSSRPELINIWKNLGDSLDVDEGIGDSPSIWTTLPTSLAALTTSSHCSPSSTSISPTDSMLGEVSTTGLNHDLMSQHHESAIVDVGKGNNMLMSAAAIQPSNINLTGTRRECLVCSDKEVTAALVPCGHNMFCMECANRICSSGDPTCPVCSLTVYHAMRILA